MRDIKNCPQCKDSEFYCEDCAGQIAEIENDLMVQAEVPEAFGY